ncbi:Vacuolar protein sorting-associated protein 18 [Vanrija pseudolonga]|uniref:Vacuolar protein sorting-associated protein 18 n=1 Tax=Vanrija pseudolonga TaxID=143232 RepID=A0AAF0Y3C5_9TREE|nr:Vacuolar protein sorting-associated protein 18 [Vanrija pseudolonga]
MSMLDDFVEHASGSSDAPRAAAAERLSHVEYEGFEPDANEADEVPSLVRALETGFVPSSRATHGLDPLFSLAVVQYSPPSDILTFTSANNILFLATHPLSVVIIDLNNPAELLSVDLPKPGADKGGGAAPDVSIRGLFADPTARHLIITTTTGDTFYLPITPGNPTTQSRRPRPLRVRHNITAVGWSPLRGVSADGSDAAKGDNITPPATDVLLGTANGVVLSLPLPPTDDIFKTVNLAMSKGGERDLQTVYTLPDGQAITGIAFGFWNAKSKRGDKRAWVVITTQERIYEVQGPVTTTVAGGKGGGWPEEVFKPVRESAPKFQELAGDVPRSELRVHVPSVVGQPATALPAPDAIAWLTAAGLYHSALSNKPTNDILFKPTLLPYPPAPEQSPTPVFGRGSGRQTPSKAPIPLSVAVTQWHFLLLFPDRVVAVARENDKVVWDEPLALAPGDQALGLAADPVSRTFWVYSARAIIEVVVTDEDRDVWRAKLDKGAFPSALEYARTPAQKDIVRSRQGDALYEEGKFMAAAQAYAESTRSFEYVSLRFVDANELDALRVYLAGRLGKLEKKDLTQRMMLATWLLEICLSKCNTLEDLIAAESATSDVENLQMERTMVEDDLQTFLKDHKANLDPSVVYELILGHGRTDLYLFYAELNKDHDKVVEHWIAEEEWTKAIDVLSRQDDIDLYYRFASLLIRNVPKETVDAWIKQQALSPRRLIPALLNQKSEPLETNQAVRYLEHVIHRQGSTDSTIYNLLLTIYASDPNPDDAPLLRFLSSVPDDPVTDRPYYDLDYALRLCKTHGRIRPCVQIYSRMGLYESSVNLALERGDIELAKVHADKPEEDDALRRKLWLKIGKYVVQEKGDIKEAMKFLESTDLVKIEDILPFFPDFVVIDDFKTEICTALEDYSARIEELKLEMDEATRSAESIKADIEALSTRFIAVEQSDKCWRCHQGITTRQFYVFPCQHSFHADCLIAMAMEYLPAPSLRRILHLQNELTSRSAVPGRQLLSQGFEGGTATPPRRANTAAGAAASAADFLLAVPGRKTLVAAGDKLRDLIVPDVLAQAVTAVGGSGRTRKKRDPDEEARAEAARKEIDSLVAGVCPLCEGSVAAIDKPFIREDEDLSDWAL